MSITLIAVVIALVVGHTMPALVALRRYDWFIRWLEWLAEQLGDNAAWRGAFGLLFAIGPPLLLVALLQVALHGDWMGFASFLFSLVVLFYAWGPRDLDHDVEAVVQAPDAASRRAAAERLFPDREGGSLEGALLDGGSLVEAVFRCALWRWFGVLFWFLLLGPFGALLYRLVALCAQGEAMKRLPEGAWQAARATLAVLDWPVAQLMTLSLALVGNFDSVFTAWKDAGGAGYPGNTRFLSAAARASVRSELADEALDDATEYGTDGTAAIARAAPGLPELRDAMSLVWRILLLWLAVLALFVIAGWVA